MSWVAVISHRTDERKSMPVARSALTGLMLTAGVAGWAGVSALHSGGRPGPLAALCLACAVAWFVGTRAAGKPAAGVVPGVVAAAGVVALAMPAFWRELGSPLGPPLGYANANAALFVQAEVAALMLLASCPRPWQRAAARVLAGIFALVPVLIGSVAASVLALGVAAAAVLRRTRWMPVACALGLALAAATTVAVGAVAAVSGPGAAGPVAAVDGTGAAGGTGSAGGTRPAVTVATPDDMGAPGTKVHVLRAVERFVEGNRRPVLWGEAFSIMARRPLWGAGPKRFAETAPTALADPDAAWAHNEFLQQGAETGVPGLVLTLALFAWALAQAADATARRGSGGEGALVPVIGMAGMTALGMHATVDYVLHFAAVPIAAAMLGGFGAGSWPDNTQRPVSPTAREVRKPGPFGDEDDVPEGGRARGEASRRETQAAAMRRGTTSVRQRLGERKSARHAPSAGNGAEAPVDVPAMMPGRVPAARSQIRAAR